MIAIVALLAIVGFVFMKGASSGPEVQGVDSMPPSVRKAFMGDHKVPTTPPGNQ